MTIKKVETQNKGLKGEIIIPADKSISHRAVMFASLAKGASIIENFSKGADCISTLEVFKNLGVEAEFKDEKTLVIKSSGKLIAPEGDLYCGNSGTTMRLMSGILAGQNFDSVLAGDESLSKRPMGRVIKPLLEMGAIIEGKRAGGHEGKLFNVIPHSEQSERIAGTDNPQIPQQVRYDINHKPSPKITAPLRIHGTQLHGVDYVSELSSAQVKSCVLLAGLHAEGKTSFTEPHLSRNHTELMLEYLGANISIAPSPQPSPPSGEGVFPSRFTLHASLTTTIERSQLQAKNITIPGDISSAAFFIVAGLIVPNSDIILKNVGLNPTRTGILDVVKMMGGVNAVEILDEKTISNELVGDLRVKYSELKGCTIGGEIIPRLIDELPVIAVLATQAQGTTIVKDAQDLRHKESDRIKAVVDELKKLGADIQETADGFIIEGKKHLTGGVEVETYHDHRLAMSLYVAGLICEYPIFINGFEWVNISFPEFVGLAERLNRAE